MQARRKIARSKAGVFPSPPQILCAGTLVMLASLGDLARADASAQTPAPSSSTVTNVQIYQTRGVVKELPAGGGSVVIKHEEITNFMPAMTMQFRPADTNELKDLAPGDCVTFRMLVTEDSGWIDRIVRVGKEAPPAATNALSQPVVYVPSLKVGDQMPDFTLTNELGRAITLDQFRGQALALTFIFTRCPFPEFCPRMSSQFQAAARRLAALTNGPANWHLLSISFDPENDSPEVLKRYAAFHQYDPSHWNFATSSTSNVMKLARLCDLTVQRDGVSFTHNLRTVVIDANGRVQDILIGNEWTPDELVKEMVAAASASTNSPAKSK